jgi:hypothetical protein
LLTFGYPAARRDQRSVVMIDAHDLSRRAYQTAEQKRHIPRSAADVQHTHCGANAGIDEQLGGEIGLGHRHQ